MPPSWNSSRLGSSESGAGSSSIWSSERIGASSSYSSRSSRPRATEPARAARLLVDGGFTPRYHYALQTLTDNPYDKGFLTTLPLAAGIGLVRPLPALAEEGAPEITSVRIQRSPSICNAPRYVAEQLLRAEGFTDIRYVSTSFAFDTVYQSFVHGEFDFITDFAPVLVYAIDQGMAVTALAGVHAGCFELFANDDIHSIADLRGKAIGVGALRSPQHMFLAPIAAHVGIDDPGM